MDETSPIAHTSLVGGSHTARTLPGVEGDMRYVTFAAVLVIALAMPMAAQTLEAQLQKAIQTETVTGDLKAAIEQYRRIAQTAGPANRRIAAQALVRMAECHRRLGDAEATKIYERILREFGDQREAAAEARTRLAGMRTPPAPRGPVSQIAREIWTGPDTDSMGVPSADGRILSYTDWTTGDLGVRDLATGQNRRLTNTGGWEKSGDFAELSVPSPDGTQIAYSWFAEAKMSAAPYDLRLMTLSNGETGRIKVLYRSDDLDWVMPGGWLPDGKSLVMLTQRKNRGPEVALISVATGAVRIIQRLTGGPQRVSVSPDGKFVAYDVPASGIRTPREVFVAAIDGSSVAAVAPHRANDGMPMFAPDGSLLFISNRGGSNALWSIAMREGKPQGAPRLIKPDIGTLFPLGITRSGALYYFVRGDTLNSFITAVDSNLAATGEPSIVSDRFQDQHGSAAWSPDGKALAFYAFHGPRENQGASLVVRDLTTREERDYPLKAQPMRPGPRIQWLPDGRSLFLSARHPSDPGLVFSRLDLTTGSEQALMTAPQMGPATHTAVLSHDGKSIFYISAEEQVTARTLRRFDIETGARTQMLPGAVHAIALSPDGRHLAYLGSTKGPAERTNDIGIIPLAGGEPRVIFSAVWLDATRFNAFSWTPDSSRILFVRPLESRGSELWHVPAAGGEARRVGISSARGQIKHPSLHPDGSRLAYSVREVADSSIWALENFLPAPATKPAARK